MLHPCNASEHRIVDNPVDRSVDNCVYKWDFSMSRLPLAARLSIHGCGQEILQFPQVKPVGGRALLMWRKVFRSCAKQSPEPRR